MNANEKISIGKGFKRSINLLGDKADKSILESFVCSASSEHLLTSMVQHIQETGQSSFTWTGPYGAGKSSLALFVSALVSGDRLLHSIATNKFSESCSEIKGFFTSDLKWQVLPIIGCLEDPVRVFSKALGIKADVDVILNRLSSIAADSDGVILFIDEMGKFLEMAAVESNVNVYFFQQLAELANRSKGKVILVGILHQSFSEYSRNLSKHLRDEWMKIQGRFIDLAINAAGEEQIELISRAIVSDCKPKRVTRSVKNISKLIVKNRPANLHHLEHFLNECWPLHPVVAALLGPVSRKRFGQNQRSIFSFLSSAEPFGFQYFLKKTKYKRNIYYTPSMYWDYLLTNLEGAILASTSSKTWVVAVEALNKCVAKSEYSISVDILKTISIIEIFKGTSGLSATTSALSSVFSSEHLAKILEELQSLSLIRYNRFSESFSLFEGSDFDIENAISDAYKHTIEIDFPKLNQIAPFLPVVAKRHYHEKGAMRWMDICIAPVSKINLAPEEKSSNSFGTFFIIIPQNTNEYEKAMDLVSKASFVLDGHPTVYSVASEYNEVFDFSRELLALEWLQKNSSELSGDKIARKEVESRYSLVLGLLGQILEQLVTNKVWFKGGVSLGSLTGLQMNSLCSNIADLKFHKTPILRTEMLNKSKASGSANGALRALLKRMVLFNGEKNLGIEGFPAEGGLFQILLKDTCLYVENNAGWEYVCPKNDPYRLSYLWEFTDTILIGAERNCKIKTLYEAWGCPPFGIKEGLFPFLILSYLLSKRGNVAVYLDGTYIPEINDIFIDYLMKNTTEISLRYVSNNNEQQKVLRDISSILLSEKALKINMKKNPSPLDVSRELVKLIDNLNPWVLRTRTLAKKTTKLREFLKSAHDPNKLIFDDIPLLYDLYDDSRHGAEELLYSLQELANAYPLLLDKLGKLLMDELQVGLVTDRSIERLKERANDVRQSSGDFRIDALAARLGTFNQTQNDIAGIASLAANKPIHDWIDLDVDRACIEIAVLCEGFKKAELYARIKGRKPNRHAITLTSGLSDDEAVHQLSFDVLEDDKELVNKIKIKLSVFLENNIDDPTLALAAMTELSIDYMKLASSNNKSIVGGDND